MEFCDCEDWQEVSSKNPTVFKWHEPYGWVLSWKELTNEVSHSKVYTYGIRISCCPLCGKKLKDKI